MMYQNPDNLWTAAQTWSHDQLVAFGDVQNLP